jgi:hypothetical protein
VWLRRKDRSGGDELAWWVEPAISTVLAVVGMVVLVLLTFLVVDMGVYHTGPVVPNTRRMVLSGGSHFSGFAASVSGYYGDGSPLTCPPDSDLAVDSCLSSYALQSLQVLGYIRQDLLLGLGLLLGLQAASLILLLRVASK